LVERWVCFILETSWVQCTNNTVSSFHELCMKSPLTLWLPCPSIEILLKCRSFFGKCGDEQEKMHSNPYYEIEGWFFFCLFSHCTLLSFHLSRHCTELNTDVYYNELADSLSECINSQHKHSMLHVCATLQFGLKWTVPSWDLAVIFICTSLFEIVLVPPQAALVFDSLWSKLDVEFESWYFGWMRGVHRPGNTNTHCSAPVTVFHEIKRINLLYCSASEHLAQWSMQNNKRNSCKIHACQYTFQFLFCYKEAVSML
jgi:hypothetical protein